LNGIQLKDKLYKVKIDAICCNMPARSFVLKIKSHTGYNSCPRCEIEGERIENRTVFLIANYTKDHQIGHIMVIQTN